MNTPSAPDLNMVLLPTEAAQYLNVSTQKLARLRREGRLHGTQVGTSKLFTYTIVDLRNADLRPRKRGPKSKK